MGAGHPSNRRHMYGSCSTFEFYVFCRLSSDIWPYHMSNDMTPDAHSCQILHFGHSGSHCLTMHSDGANCMHIVASPIRLVVALKLSHAAGTENGTQSTSDSNYLWNGTISLAIGYHNVTIEYHNGNGGGTLILRSGYAVSNVRVSGCE